MAERDGEAMTRLRRLAALVVLMAIFQLALVARARSHKATHDLDLAAADAITRELGLTDLAIWTEARYTRHPSLADRATAFQEHPGSLEHFPAGGIVVPPPHLLPSSAAAVTKP
jgi:hypothetical protein